MNMNGETSPIPQIVMGNPVLELLAGIINEVKAGRVTTVAVLAVAPQGGVATPYVGPQAGGSLRCRWPTTKTDIAEHRGSAGSIAAYQGDGGGIGMNGNEIA